MNKKQTYNIALGAMFTALILVMAFTPLGYLRIGTVEITFLPIPVAIGAILMGPAWGTYFGLLFGLTSFAVGFGGSGAAMIAVSVWRYAFVTVVPRIIVGFGCGMVYKLLKERVNSTFSVIAASVLAPILNTVLFLSALIGCYYNTEVVSGLMSATSTANVLALALAIAGINAVIELIACTVISVAASTFINKMAEMREK